MTELRIPKACFWTTKNDIVQVVVSTDERMFELTGLPARVFLAVAQSHPLGDIRTHPKFQRVVTDLQSLGLVEAPIEAP